VKKIWTFLKKAFGLFGPFSPNFEKDVERDLEREKKEQLERDRSRKS